MPDRLPAVGRVGPKIDTDTDTDTDTDAERHRAASTQAAAGRSGLPPATAGRKMPPGAPWPQGCP